MSISVVPGAESANVVRVSVAAGDRVTDLVLPSRLPLAELVPEVAAVVGALDPYDVHGGYSLVQADGRSLDLDSSLLAQGVHDGSLLSLVAGADIASARVYDDLVEAVADTVESSGSGWGPTATRRSMLSGAGLLLTLGALVLYLQRDAGLTVVAVASAASVLLLLAGAVFARARNDRSGAVVVLAGAAAYAVVAAAAAAVGQPFGWAALLAGGALLVVGTLATFILPRRGWTFMPAFVLGAVALSVGLVVAVVPGLDPARVLAVLVVVTVIAGSAIPWFALSAARALPPPLASENQILAEADEIDVERVGRQIQLAHEVVLGLACSVATLVVVAAPSVVELGWAGLGVIWAAGLVQIMRTRQFVLAEDVLIGLVGGTASIVSGTLAGVLRHPQWGGAVGVIVAVLAVVVLAALAAPSRSSVRVARLLDVIEGVVLFSLVPLLVLALGLAGGH